MASSKNTGLTLTLVFFVITTLASSVWAIVMTQENQDKAATWQADQQKARDADQVAKATEQDIITLKKMIGHDFQQVGTPDSDPNDESVVNALRNDINKYAGDLQEETVQATLQNMHARMVELTEQLAQKQAAYDELQVRLAQLDKTQQDLRNEIEVARKAAEELNQKNTEVRLAQLEAKDDLIREKQNEVSAAEGRAEEAAQKLADLEAETSQRINDLRAQVRKTAEELQEIKKVSFEHPDGMVVQTSRDKRKVYINLGSSDKLPTRMTFSVYKKDHSGVARTQDDIKGKIEITRIIDSHMAEARVVDANLFLPITAGDPIYTPLWSPGRTEKMAIVGFIDLDGDGRSDREDLRELIKAAGASVVAEIQDDGTTVPENADFHKLIDTHVKFVILGEMPDPSSTSIPEEQQQIQKVLAHFNEMREAANDNGVRLVSLNDFLSFIGYKAERRLWRPGDKRGYTLKNGSRSAAVDQTISRLGDGSAGQTAGKYSRHPLLKSRTSTDQTSKRYAPRNSGR